MHANEHYNWKEVALGEVCKVQGGFAFRSEDFVDGLNGIPGFHCTTPHGAFYAFPNITGTGMSSRELANQLLENAGVACLSGTAFGSYGEGYLRFSYANSLENIQEALHRVRTFIASR